MGESILWSLIKQGHLQKKVYRSMVSELYKKPKFMGKPKIILAILHMIVKLINLKELGGMLKRSIVN